MEVALPGELEKRIEEVIGRGEFSSRAEFLKEAAELLLDSMGEAAPIPVDGEWEQRLETLMDESGTDGPPVEMTDRDWIEVERRGLALIRERKKM